MFTLFLKFNNLVYGIKAAADSEPLSVKNIPACMTADVTERNEKHFQYKVVFGTETFTLTGWAKTTAVNQINVYIFN